MVAVGELLHRRDLIGYLVVSTLRASDRDTALGYLWWLLDPLLQMSVYVMLVTVVFERGGPDFPVFVFLAVLPWRSFTVGVNDAVSSLIRGERVMRQVAFPRAVLPVAAVLAGYVHFLVGFVALLPAMMLFFRVPPTETLALLPIVIVVQLCLTLGLGLFAAAANLFFRDLHNIIKHVFNVWFYASPGIYSLAMVPDGLRPYYMLNPFANIFNAYRDVVMYGKVPDGPGFLYAAGVSLLTLAGGLAFFKRVEPTFAKIL